MKVCLKCGIEKDFNEFYKHKSRKDGLSDWCKFCQKKANIEYKKKNKSKIKLKEKEYREKNKNKIRTKAREYYHKNKEKRAEYMKKWRNENPNYSKKYRENNDRSVELREYFQKNKSELTIYQREYRRKNKIMINGIQYNINTCDEEIKPIIQGFINLKIEKKILKGGSQ